MARSIRFRLNGAEREMAVEDHVLLAELIRGLGLTGTKVSCDLQVCGVCTVLLDDLPVSSCSTLAVEADGRSVRTIEGLADDGELHPVQRAFIDHFAFQCGYCTPGMIMSAAALLEQEPHPDRARILHWMEGNICRCTGYEGIVNAIVAAAGRTEVPR